MDFQEQFILLKGTVFGNIQIRYYGIIIVIAMLIAAWMASRLADRRKMNSDHVWGGLTWAIFPGIIGARLWFVLFPPVTLTAGCATGGVCMDTAWFLQHFFDPTNGAIAVWSGGLSIFGAVLGGGLGAWLYCSRYHNAIARFFYYLFSPLTLVFGLIAWVFMALWELIRRKPVTRYRFEWFVPDFPAEGIDIVPWLDIVGVVMPLAQAIGRWANYVNKELYGTPTQLPWGITIDNAHRVGIYQSLVDYPVETKFHPLFLYESLWNLLAFFVLFTFYNRHRLPIPGWARKLPAKGDFALLYVMQYCFVRFLLEFIRAEVAYVPGTQLNSSQVFCVLAFLIAGGIFFMRKRVNADEVAVVEDVKGAKGVKAAKEAQASS